MARWDEVRSNLIDLYTTAAQRTEEWTRLGVGHYDRFGLGRQLDRHLANLGAEVYRILRQGDEVDLEGNERIQECLRHIRDVERALEDKQREINDLRQSPEAAPESDSAAETTDSL